MTERMTISMDDELAERINGQLEYGDNRSELIRELLREALDERESPDESMPDTPDVAIQSGDTDQAAATQPDPDVPEHLPVSDVPDDLPKSVDEDAAREAIGAAAAYLREHGSATMREIVRDVMPGHPLGYDVPELKSGDRYRGAWWRRIVKPGLEMRDEIKKPTGGRSEWRWVG